MVAGAVEDFLTAPFTAVALTVISWTCSFASSFWVLLKSRRAPVRGPCGGLVAGNRRQ